VQIMTSDDVMRWAIQAGVDVRQQTINLSFLEDFAALVAAAEREACAKKADYYAANSITAKSIASAIRVRGEA